MGKLSTAESWGIWLVVFVMMWLGFFFGYMHCRDSFRKEAVKRGAAEYNAQTGDWQWKTTD